MVKRKARKAKRRKMVKRPARRKMAHRRKSRKALSSSRESLSHFRKTHWAVYEDLQKRAKKALTKLRTDVKRKASPHILLEDRNNLLLLLGECNYMAEECMRTGAKRL